MTIERGIVRNTLLRHLFVNKMKGNNILTAPVNLNKVRENGFTRPARLADAKNDPATKVVASMTSR